MNLPFSQEQFFLVFKSYNEAVWPTQILLGTLAIVAVAISIRKIPSGGRWVSTILGILWLWMGAVYHIGFFASINPVAHVFGAAFVLQGVVFLWVGTKNNISFQWRNDWGGIVGAFLFIFALLLYPLLGYLQDHTYPFSPTFGLPCPTTIFTWGMFLWASRLPRLILVIPGIWSVIGFSAAISLAVLEDIGLLVSALIALPMILVRKAPIAGDEQ